MEEIQIEMYERMLKAKDEEINRLWILLKMEKSHTHHHQVKDQPKINTKLYSVVYENIEKMELENIKKFLSVPSPAYKSIVSLLKSVFETNDQICTISYQNYVTYVDQAGNSETTYYTHVFDNIFKKIYDKCLIACENIHDNITTEHDNNISDYCHENMMMLVCESEKKEKLQKELLKILKPLMKK
jgi:CRISPR/Cas system CSM-associated protein Csm2 small subunit